MNSSDEDTCLTPDSVKEEAKLVIENLLPENSKERYLKAYDDFIKWRTEKKVKSLSESVLISYFNELAKKLRPSSLWSIYSMLKTTLNMKHNVDLKNYVKLAAFLKRQSDGYKCKKSMVFTAQEVETFLNNAPDETHLATKVPLILGITGACRTIELANITMRDVEKHGDLILIKLPNTKTKIDRTFVVRDEFVKFVKKYQDLRPEKMQTNRFFLNFSKGKCTRQVIGKNKLASLPKQIATYLKLPNPELYTGHSFRRTSATLLADSGANLTTIKRHGGWKSSSVAEGYIQDSVENKSKITSRITETIHLRNTSTSFDSSEPRPCSSKDCDDDVIKQIEESKDTITIVENGAVLPNSQVALSQKMKQSINIPGKPVTLSLSNCSHFTINFN